MAELNFFQYLPGNSWLHRKDSRIKLIATFLFMLAVMFTDWKGYIILSCIVVFIFLSCHLPVFPVLRDIKYFFIIICIVIVVRAFSIPGTPLISDFPYLTINGLISGFLFSWKIILVIFVSNLLTLTTSLSRINDSISWMFRPFPFINETHMATMISLTLNMVPLIFEEANEILQAQHARCIQGQKNIFKRIYFFILPVFIQTFLRSDDIIMAMESRCYNDDRTKPEFALNSRDILFFIFSIAIVFILVVVKFI